MKNQYTFFYFFKQLNQWKKISLFKANNNKHSFRKANFLWSSILFFVLIAFTTSKVNAQTYLIDPTVSTATTNITNIGNGSFEAVGTTTSAVNSFTANGWTSSATSLGPRWIVGTMSTTPSAANGTKAAYISTGTTPTANWGSSSSWATMYFYRDITVPVGTNSVNLTFQWKGYGNGTTDKATVYLTPATFTPVANNTATNPGLPSSTYSLWVQPVPTSTVSAPTGWTTLTMSIPVSSLTPGTAQKLIFAWQQDGTANSNTAYPIAIDAVELTYFTTGCSSAPAAATASISSTNGCSSSVFTLTASGASALLGITNEWQSSTDGGVTWANTGVSSPTYTNTASVTTSYQYVSTCSAASASVASNAVTYSVNTCAVTIDMLDVGNGWNGASVDLVINGSTFLNCGSTFTAGVSQTINTCVPANSSYSLVCISAGSAPGEPGIKLTINSVLQYSIAANDTLMTTGATLATGYACQVFTAAPSCVPTASISPASGQSGVALSQVLSWPAMPQAGSYDVYFGTAANPPFVGNQVGTSYNPGGLAANTQYYWRIVPKNGSYTDPTCNTVFSFNTGIAGCGGGILYLSNPTYNCNGSQYVYSTCTYFGEYNILNNVVAGTYTFGANITSYVTIKSSTGIILAAGPAPLVYTFTAPSASYRIQLNSPTNCGTDFSCHSVWVQCGTPPIAAPTSISSSTTAVCAGSAVTFTANGTPPASSNVYWFTGSCATNTAAAIATGSVITVNPTVSATYYANNFNGTAWSSCVTQFITVSASPALMVSSSATICPGSITTLTASANSIGVFINDNCAQIGTNTITAGTPGTVQGTLTGVYPDIVSVSNTSNAGGIAGEANLAGWSFSNTTDRLTYGPISTVGNTSLTLTWSNYLRHYSSTYAYGVSVQTSTNINGPWTNTTWSVAPVTASIPVGTQSVVVSTADVGSPNFYLSFRLFGATYGIWNWYIDNVLLTGASAASPVTWTPITGLFTDAVATAAYASTATNTVYSKPVANVTYSASATGANGCVSTSSVSVSLQVPNISPAPVAGDFIWSGNTSTAWGTATNWYQTNGTFYSVASTTPTANDNAIVAPTGSCIVNQPTVLSSGLAKNLTINAGAILTLAANSAVTASNVTIANNASISMNPSSSSTLNVAGNWTNIGIFDEGFGTVNFNGATAQTINTSSSNETFYDVALNNSNGGVTLNDTVKITHDMNLTSGKLTSSATNLLIFKDNATASNASNSSFVSGPVRKIGDDPFIFPVGKVGDYAPIAITSPTATTDYFTAEYFLTDPNPLYNRSSKDPSLSNISACEYWILDRAMGASDVKVQLSWNTPRSCGVGLLADLRVARWDGASPGSWRDHSIGALSGNTTTGTIETPAVVTNFSPFALASVSVTSNPLSNAPLPIELTKFDATCEDEKIHITWSTASETNNDYYTIERSIDGVSFDAIARVDAKGNANAAANYSIQDGNPINGISYYRLTQTDFDKNSKTYNIVGVSCSSKNSSVVVYPNPNNGIFTIQGLEIGAELILTDVLGKIIYKAITSELKTQLNLSNLSRGIYYLSTNNELNRNEFKKIIIN